ncbi:MAG: SHOCT domain-containing protein [Chloroflexi bacterium]|nr:SHOCT domain-containing protein [Chloroflexota bacterium]MCI0783422.1 SHOCT domain-containing protein [Chloroflexota bacterium]MCI0818113.1 SHOCT domain-containing protein [Chloroflexota bacterium]MCI0818987.1 SHOCT domain-containing protein [Chloroflexota bacterium]MCI0831465.1 SHOCT domain-containing protein [Chloroflexota bacterium]
MNSIFLTSFWDVVVWIVIVWFWAMVIWMFITVFADIFRRRDLSGIAKAFWIFLIFILPLIGILIYFIARPADATAEQDAEIMAAQRRAMGYSATAEIEKGQQLLAAGTITQAEFDSIKARALQ